jgi:hypothetical protein
LCEAHDLPFRHDPECQTFRDFEPVRDEELALASLPGQERTLRWAQAWYEETLVGWRDLSAQMRATLRIARRLQDGVVADDRDWGALPFLRDVLATLIVPALEQPLSGSDDYPDTKELEQRSGLTYDQVEQVVRQEHAAGIYPEQRSPHGEGHEVFWETYRRLAEAIGRHQMQGSLVFQRQLLSEVLNYWLNLAGVRPRLEWTARNPAIELGGDGLIGALVVDLLFACSRSAGVVVCTACGTPFLPERRRARGDRNAYCADCGLKAAARDAAARYRRTQKYRDTYQNWVQQRRVE